MGAFSSAKPVVCGSIAVPRVIPRLTTVSTQKDGNAVAGPLCRVSELLLLII